MLEKHNSEGGQIPIRVMSEAGGQARVSKAHKWTVQSKAPPAHIHVEDVKGSSSQKL